MSVFIRCSSWHLPYFHSPPWDASQKWRQQEYDFLCIVVYNMQALWELHEVMHIGRTAYHSRIVPSNFRSENWLQWAHRQCWQLNVVHCILRDLYYEWRGRKKLSSMPQMHHQCVGPGQQWAHRLQRVRDHDAQGQWRDREHHATQQPHRRGL